MAKIVVDGVELKPETVHVGTVDDTLKTVLIKFPIRSRQVTIEYNNCPVWFFEYVKSNVLWKFDSRNGDITHNIDPYKTLSEDLWLEIKQSKLSFNIKDIKVGEIRI